MSTVRLWQTLVILVWSLVATGCKQQRIVCSPTDFTGCVIDDVDIVGNEKVPDSDIEEKIATAATGGTFEGVPLIGAIDTLTVQYERFDQFVLERDLQRVARIYRAKGYYDAVVRAGRVRRIDKHKPNSLEVANMRLLVEIVVHEGEPVLVQDVKLLWEEGAPKDGQAALAALGAKAELARNAIFAEEDYERARAKIERALTSRGYAYAHVEPTAAVDLAKHRAVVTYTVRLGPKCTFGKVTIEGLGSIPEWQVRPALGIDENEPYSTDTFEAAEIALNDLGVFASITIEPQRSREPPLATKIPIKVKVQPALLGSVKLGLGAELGDQVAVRGAFGWQHRNATGALDRFAVEARPRGVLYPWRISTFATGDVRFIPELTLRWQYSLPFPADPKATLFVQSQASYGLERNHDPPDRLPDDADVPVEILLEHRQGYQRRFFLSRLLLSLSHNLSFSNPFLFPFDESAAESLLISYVDLFGQLDLRKNWANKYDHVRPAKGFMGTADIQVAGFIFGGRANDVKLRPEVRGYVPLAKGFTLAGRFSMGFLYTDNYGTVLDDPIPVGDVLAESGDASYRSDVNLDVSILSKRGLFSGGPTSNRGYGFNEIGPHRVVDDDGNRLADPDAIGGRTLWEASLEFRFPIKGAWSGTAFVEASDVTAGFGELRIDHPHLSTGLGINYDSPIGPLRVDFGFRIPYMQVVGEEVTNCTNESTDATWECTELVIDEAEPADFFGAPLALSIAIGNAF